MKRISLFLAILLMLTVYVGCSDKKAPTQKKVEYTFSHQDSIDVLNLVNRFKGYLEENDLRSAVEMLSIVKGDSLLPLEPIQQRRQAMALSMVKGVQYDVDYMMFHSDRNNEVKLNITLFEKDENDSRPNTIAFFLRPVRHEGQWFLTTKDVLTDRENGHNFQKEGMESDTEGESEETDEE